MFGKGYVLFMVVLISGSMFQTFFIDDDADVIGGDDVFSSTPICHWTFNEGSGSIVGDVSGNDLNGTLSGPSWVPGIQGTGLLFDDDYDQVVVPDNPLLDISTSLTMELWFNATEFDSDGKSGGNMMLRKWQSSPVGQYAVAAYGGGGVRYWLAGDGEFQALDIQSVLTLNEWHYMVCTWDGNTMKLFIDGDFITDQATSFHTLNPNDFSGDDLCMGELGTHYAFKGVLDEVAIYDRALSATEIGSKYKGLWPIHLNRVNDTWTIDEDTEFTLDFENLGSCPDPVWTFETDSDWLRFDEMNNTVFGTPDNGDIGWANAMVTISDGGIYSDKCDLWINVKNVVPVISDTDLKTIDEDQYYYADYGCSEDGEPGIEWTYTSNAGWLRFNRTTAVLNGTPENDDVGVYDVTIRCDDNNSGKDIHSFKVTVKNTNDIPFIITEDILTVDQDFKYKNSYSATDPDVGDSLSWSLSTNASWLSMKDNIVEGTPKWNDIGRFLVNVSVQDMNGGMDHHSFTLTVNNLNDPPRYLHVPSNATVDEGTVYSDIAEAVDFDAGDSLVFSIRSNPVSDIIIDPSTGLISWKATTDVFDTEPYVLFVYITVSDGTVDMRAQFRITVNETPIIPSKTEMISPKDASRIKLVGSALEWVGTPGMAGELSYTVYLHQTMSYVVNKNGEAVYLNDYSYTKIDLTNLEPGKKYYWTVIPTEGEVVGSCSNGIRSFFVNNIPTFTTPVVPKAAQGAEFTLKVQGDDLDQEDSQHLRYTLLKSPEGMSIGNQSGLIRWTPGKDQVGNHEVEVSISDGMEGTELSFIVEVVQVQKDDPKDNSAILLLSIGIIMVVLFIVGMAIVIVVLTRRKERPQDVRPQDVQETVIGSHGEPDPLVKTGSTVPTTLADAYIRPAQPRSYKEMYGTNPPQQEGAVSAKELQDSLKKDIWALENPEE